MTTRISVIQRALTLCLLLLAGGCHSDHHQSALHPASSASTEIATLWWVMFGLLAAAFVLVMTLVAVAVWRKPAEADCQVTQERRARLLVIGGGIAFPGIVLLGMLFYSLGTSFALRRPAQGIRIEVTGHQWWWEVRYPTQGVVIANEIYLPAGEPTVIELRAADVIHSFWVPNLHGKIDLLPEMATRIVLEPERAGEWRGQCAEFCGRQHAWMAIKVIALPRAEFDAWVLARQRPERLPESELLRRGEAVFFRASCHACHTIAGTPANARLGPDLTHFGSRLTIGAGRIENTDKELAQWILDPQRLKPGNLMPATPLTPEDLDAIVAYLRSHP